MTTQTGTNKHELNGLLVGGIKDNKRSHKWSKYKRIRSGEEKRSGGARRAEEAETDSHRVMGKQRRLWEIWCKGLDLSNGNRLATQRGQLPLSPLSLSVLTPLSGRGETGGGLKCKRGRGSETGGKWEEQRAEWKRDEAEMVPVPAHGGFSACVLPCAHICMCVCVCVCVLVYEQVSRETVCRLSLARTYSYRITPRGPFRNWHSSKNLQGMKGKSNEWKVEWHHQ